MGHAIGVFGFGPIFQPCNMQAVRRQRSAAREEAEDRLDALLLAFDAMFVC
jgi:hypothetical protein